MCDRWTLAFLAGFVVLRIGLSIAQPGTDHDSPTYQWLNFLGGKPRLWTVPLLYNLVPANYGREVAQILVGLVSWSAMALSLAAILRDKWVKRGATTVVLALGLVPQVTMWDAAMLSESLDISLIVLLLALLLRLANRVTPRLLAATVLVTVLWMFARQENVLTYLALLPLVAGFALWKLPRRAAAGLLAALVLAGGWGGFCVFVAESRGGIWVYNAGMVLVARVPQDRQLTGYLGSRGMDVALLRRAPSRDEAGVRWLLRDHLWFRRWIVTHFRGDYSGFLVSHPGQALIRPFTTLTPYITTSIAGYDVTPHPLPGVGQWLWSSDGTHHAVDLVAWMMLAMLLPGAALLRRRSPPFAPIVLFLVAASAVMVVNAYDFAAMEQPRLYVPAALMVRLTLILAAISGSDALLRSRVVRDRVLGDAGRPDAGEVASAG